VALPPVLAVPVLLSDSVTVFGAAGAGAVLVTGSHGGASALAYAIASGARGVVVNDAGIGKEEAGISGLGPAALAGVGVVAVGHESACIGHGRDTWERGIVRHVNGPAMTAGIHEGMHVAEAVVRLAEVSPPDPRPGEPVVPGRSRVVDAGPPPVLLFDSAAAVGAAHAGAVVISGSHGGAAHGRALDAPVLAAVFNDAGIGRECAGVGRLPILDTQGVMGLTVAHTSARIGDAEDTWASGIISVVNETAAAAGLRVGETVQASVARILERRSDG
jgi:hypothetical protein